MSRRDNPDGTDRLCRVLYNRRAKPQDYIGGSESPMLHDAADRLERVKAAEAEVERQEQRCDDLEGALRLMEARIIGLRAKVDRADHARFMAAGWRRLALKLGGGKPNRLATSMEAPGDLPHGGLMGPMEER